MTKDETIACFKYCVVKHVYKNRNIISTCKVLSLPRNTYHKGTSRA